MAFEYFLKFTLTYTHRTYTLSPYIYLQSRYVGYFEKVKKKLDGKVPSQVPKKISAIKIFNLTGNIIIGKYF